MDSTVGLTLGMSLAVGLAALGVALGLGRAVSSALDALGRQPDAMGKILTVMLTGCALIEAIFFIVMFLGKTQFRG
jgi:F-type H+-transporting ATPase subunit c